MVIGEDLRGPCGKVATAYLLSPVGRGHIAPGSIDNNLIVLEDLMATFAAILSVELPSGSAEDSYNILPYLTGAHTGPPCVST